MHRRTCCPCSCAASSTRRSCDPDPCTCRHPAAAEEVPSRMCHAQHSFMIATADHCMHTIIQRIAPMLLEGWWKGVTCNPHHALAARCTCTIAKTRVDCTHACKCMHAHCSQGHSYFMHMLRNPAIRLSYACSGEIMWTSRLLTYQMIQTFGLPPAGHQLLHAHTPFVYVYAPVLPGVPAPPRPTLPVGPVAIVIML